MTLSDPRAGWRPGRVVHILDAGAALCPLTGVPSSWPEGHVWVPITQHYLATCDACLEAYERMHQ